MSAPPRRFSKCSPPQRSLKPVPLRRFSKSARPQRFLKHAPPRRFSKSAPSQRWLKNSPLDSHLPPQLPPIFLHSSGIHLQKEKSKINSVDMQKAHGLAEMPKISIKTPFWPKLAQIGEKIARPVSPSSLLFATLEFCPESHHYDIWSKKEPDLLPFPLWLWFRRTHKIWLARMWTTSKHCWKYWFEYWYKYCCIIRYKHCCKYWYKYCCKWWFRDCSQGVHVAVRPIRTRKPECAASQVAAKIAANVAASHCKGNCKCSCTLHSTLNEAVSCWKDRIT